MGVGLRLDTFWSPEKNQIKKVFHQKNSLRTYSWSIRERGGGRRSSLTIMKKIMDIEGKCENLITYILIFKITNNIENKRNKSKITIFEKLWGALDPPRPF